MTGRYERVEVITGVARRRRWSAEEKLRVVNELSRPGATVSLVARRNDINSSLLFKWRKLAREGAFGALPDGDAGFVPVRLAMASAALVAPVAADAGSGGERDEPGRRDCVAERLSVAGSGGSPGVVSASAGDGAEDGGLMPVALPAGTKVYLALAPVDMRKGYDGLAASVQQILKRDPFSGHLFLFRGKRGDGLKALWWDGGGLCLFAKRLEKGRFVWPQVKEGAITLSPAQLAMLIEGLDWRRAVAFNDLPTPTAV
jgi:transposase